MGETTERAQLVREHLLVDKDAVFLETVKKAGRVLKMDERGGVHPQVELSEYGSKQKIEWFLLGRYLGKWGELVDRDSGTDQEMARFFGLEVHEIQKRIHDLKTAGVVEVTEPRTYRLTEARLNEVLRDLGVE